MAKVKLSSPQLLKDCADGGKTVIKLTGINNKEVILNAEQIEKLEEVPESVITMLNGNKYIVIESLDEIVDKVIEYKRKIFKSDYK